MHDTSGIETARRIRSVVGKDASIIVLTAYDWSDIEKEAKEAGVNAFCAKPLFMSVLKSALLAANNIGDLNLSDTGAVWTQTDYSGKRILLVEDNELNREIAEVSICNKRSGFVHRNLFYKKAETMVLICHSLSFTFIYTFSLSSVQ